jgi:glycerophosphoryl diester phosphodiesterase
MLTNPTIRSFTLRALSLAALAAALLAAPIAAAQQAASQPTLKGIAIMPADTFADGPATGAKIDPASNLFGRTIPFEKHPVQGVSGAIPAGNGNYFILSDNGFGTKANSSDYLLRFYEVKLDFPADKIGTVEVVRFVQLADPDKLVPFPIVNNDTPDRLLTGADFDVESFRIAPDGTFWIGEEFGPFLLHFSAEGKLLDAPIPTPFPAVLEPFAKGLKFIQSPDNPDFVSLADQPARNAAANGRSSRGFEGMAINVAGDKLYTMLEGAMTIDPFGNRLLIQEFDIATKQYTGKYFFYPMNAVNYAIGELTAVNENEYLVIERDNNEGNAAAFKRIFKIDLSKAYPDGSLAKTQVVDLMAIKDEAGLTKEAEDTFGFGPEFKFPFVTIESVYPVDANTLLVVNDNNFPFSNGRRPGKASDDTEFILVTLPEALNLTAK